MSRRGEVTIECDVPGCHAEFIFEANRALSIDEAIRRDGWHQMVGRDICPDCADEEGK